MRTPTHLFLDKGKACIPDSMMDEFRAHWARDMESGTTLCVSENRTMVFPMYVDLDLKVRNVILDPDAVATIYAC